MIDKYPHYMGHEPHVQSSGSIILKEPSVMSSSQPRLNVNPQNINSRDYLESLGGRGLKSSTNMQAEIHDRRVELNNSSKTTQKTIEKKEKEAFELRKLRILPATH